MNIHASSPVKFDASLVKRRLRDIAKESELTNMVKSGMDEKSIKKAIKGKVWGWEVTCNKITEYEKTQTFGYGDSGIGYRIFLLSFPSICYAFDCHHVFWFPAVSLQIL